MSLQLLSQSGVVGLIEKRRGEIKLGERIHYPEAFTHAALDKARMQGVKYAILGIPESIGIMGNAGKPNAELAWNAFLKAFLNVQHNRFLDLNSVCVLGEVDVSFLQKRAESLDSDSSYYLQKLHLLCEELDELVTPVIELIVKAGIVPIVIGGGHNNAFPILKGASLGLDKPLNAINLDAHADFRPLEGRHSGNGFSYAMQARVLQKYAVFGLHQNYNAEYMLKALDSLNTIHYTFLEDLKYFGEDLNKALSFVQDQNKVGLEIDMDAIRSMPSDAISPTGFSLEQARSYIKTSKAKLDIAYLHLAEGAPNNLLEENLLGKALSYLVTDFIKA